MTVTPPNLCALFGDRFRIGHDPAAKTPTQRSDPWMMQMPCRGQGVTIYPHGEGMLAVQCDNRRFVAKQLADLGLALHQDGEDEKTFVFPVAMFEQVAPIVRPLRRPALTEKQRADKAARMRVRNADKNGPIGGNGESDPPKAA